MIFTMIISKNDDDEAPHCDLWNLFYDFSLHITLHVILQKEIITIIFEFIKLRVNEMKKKCIEGSV